MSTSPTGAATKSGGEPRENEYSSERGRRPAEAVVRAVRVLRRTAISPSFVRITFTAVASGEPAPVGRHGGDQWFRLFLPQVGQDTVLLPVGGIEGWFQRLNSLPADRRPVVRNYTVRDLRIDGGEWELDVDFLLHRDAAGALEGRAATWAVDVAPGAVVGILDQGVIARAEGRRRLLLVCDATGLPGVEGILRDLPATSSATVVVELPDPTDRRDLPGAGAVDLRWTVAQGWREELTAEDFDVDYVYAVGGVEISRGVRQAALAAGVPSDHVDFCSYWRHRPERSR